MSRFGRTGVHEAAVAVLFVMLSVLTGCVSVASGPSATQPPPIFIPTFSRTSTPTPNTSARPDGASGVPHDAPELEGVLPRSVQGRELSVWSIKGEALYSTLNYSAEEQSAMEAVLSAFGAQIDDFAQGTAGRSNTQTDPPYFVFALMVDGVDTSEIPREFMLGAGPETSWAEDTIAGKRVDVGGSELINQDEHIRGEFYLYDTPDVRFVIVTDDPAWAEDALSQLP